MYFVKTEELKIGMRMARPIFTKDGALLFDRDSKLTEASLNNVKNFGLVGLYVLEPAEPVPPMTEEEIEFERFQTVTSHAIQKELECMVGSKKTQKLDTIVASISKNYGHQTNKIHFIQGLRSDEDYIYKHLMNTSILTALIGHRMNARIEDRNLATTCSLFYDIGKLMLPRDTHLDRMEGSERNAVLRKATDDGIALVKDIFLSSPMYYRICNHVTKCKRAIQKGEPYDGKPMLAASMIMVASTFDELTAMSSWSEPISELSALNYMIDRPKYFEPSVVNALVKSLTVLQAGISVELSTGETALVIQENEDNFLRPMVLSYQDNSMIDLSNTSLYGDIYIKDIQQKMDNRIKWTNDEL